MLPSSIHIKTSPFFLLSHPFPLIPIDPKDKIINTHHFFLFINVIYINKTTIKIIYTNIVIEDNGYFVKKKKRDVQPTTETKRIKQ